MSSHEEINPDSAWQPGETSIGIPASMSPELQPFKPCIFFKEGIGITEVVIEDAAYVAIPMFEGVHHFLDKHLAINDGRLVGASFWVRPPEPSLLKVYAPLEDPEAVFEVKIFLDRTQTKVVANTFIAPERLLKLAIEALEAELAELKRCPAHQGDQA